MSETLMFRVPLSQVGGRLDPHFYQPSTVVLLKKLQDSPHPNKKLSELVVHRCTGDWGEDEELIDSDEQYQRCLVLRSTEFENGANLRLNGERRKYRKLLKTKLDRMRIEENDILIEKSGGSPDQPVGRVAQLTPNVLAHGFIAYSNFIEKIKPDRNLVLPEYLFHYMRMLHTIGITNRLQSQTNGIRNLMMTDYLKLPICLPSRDEQLNVATIMREAYAQKAQLESEAKTLLESVDAVLYQHWRCTSPSLPEGLLSQRIFKVTLNAIDDRLDAPANWTPLNLSSALYPSTRLNQVAKINPSTDFSSVGSDDAVSFVPMDCVDEVWGEVMEEYSRPYSESKGYTEFQEGDVLWAKITPCMQNGKSAIAQGLLHQRGFGSTEFHVFRVDAMQLDARYLLAVLRLKYLRQFAALFFGGSAGHQRVDASFFQKLAIPLPPLTVQQKIATEIEALKIQAQTLRQQAQATLDQAKQQVEKIILGEMA
jgi:Type I restriction modification DNA specificity domain